MTHVVQFKAYARKTRGGEIEYVGTFSDAPSAIEAVVKESEPARKGLRCLFRWSGNEYRCAPREESTYGRIEIEVL